MHGLKELMLWKWQPHQSNQKFRASPIKTPESFFQDAKTFLNYMETQISKNSQSHPEQNNTIRGITIRDSKLCYWGVVIETAWYWHKIDTLIKRISNATTAIWILIKIQNYTLEEIQGLPQMMREKEDITIACIKLTKKEKKERKKNRTIQPMPIWHTNCITIKP